MNRIIILGPQACGKGTQGKILAEYLNIPKISTGELFRKEISEKTELGKEIEPLVLEGKLISDEITFELLKKRLSMKDCKNGYILDGFPRNINQAKFLNTFIDIDHVIEVNITDEEAVRRIQTRRICEKCGVGYDIVLFPPKTEGICDKCGGNIIIRPDDYKEAIKERLFIYRREVEEILKFYKEKNILTTVSGADTIENVAKKIKTIFK